MDAEILDYEVDADEYQSPTPSKSWADDQDYEPIVVNGVPIHYYHSLESYRRRGKLCIDIPFKYGEFSGWSYAQAIEFLKSMLNVVFFYKQNILSILDSNRFYISVKNDDPRTTNITMFMQWNSFGIVDYSIPRADPAKSMYQALDLLLPFTINSVFGKPTDGNDRPNKRYTHQEIYEFLLFVIRGMLQGRAITKIMQDSNQVWVKTSVSTTKRACSATIETCYDLREEVTSDIIPDVPCNVNLKHKYCLKKAIMLIIDKM